MIKLLISTIALAFVARPVLSQSQLAFPVIVSEKINNTFDLQVPSYVQDQILNISGEKMVVKSVQITFNDHPFELKSCKTRGNTTLQYRRKSFSLSLIDPITLRQVQVNRLAINNLAMDKNYWRARLCFMLMKAIEIFPLNNQYTELQINGQTQGTYLMIQKPEDYCRSLGANLLVRRTSGGKTDVEYYIGKEDKKMAKKLKHCGGLNKLYKEKQLYDSLSQIINMEQYNRWLAFNYLILNGDYTDELFLFLNPETNRFDIIPWDYDDVFASGPHEGLKRRNQILGDRLLFSSETNFDLMIAEDDYLYSNYLKTFYEVVNILTPEFMREVFEQAYLELHPFFTNPAVIAQSKYDEHGLTTLNILQDDLNNHYQFLVRRRSTVKNKIAVDLKLISQ